MPRPPVPLQGAFGLRWFTPEVEVDLCGHATLASAHVLFTHGYAVPLDIVFHYQGGALTVTQEGNCWRCVSPLARRSGRSATRPS